MATITLNGQTFELDDSIAGGLQLPVMPGPFGGGPVSSNRRQAPVIRLTGETRTKFSAIAPIVA